jgi:hypothetical protein
MDPGESTPAVPLHARPMASPSAFSRPSLPVACIPVRSSQVDLPTATPDWFCHAFDDGLPHPWDAEQVQGLLDGPPIVLGEQHRVATLPGDLDRFVIRERRVDQPIQVAPGGCGRNRLHHMNVRHDVRISSVDFTQSQDSATAAAVRWGTLFCLIYTRVHSVCTSSSSTFGMLGSFERCRLPVTHHLIRCQQGNIPFLVCEDFSGASTCGRRHRRLLSRPRRSAFDQGEVLSRRHGG